MITCPVGLYLYKHSAVTPTALACCVIKSNTAHLVRVITITHTHTHTHKYIYSVYIYISHNEIHSPYISMGHVSL